MNCVWISKRLDDGRYDLTCELCGYHLISPNGPDRTYGNCGRPLGASFLRKAANFARAVARQSPLFIEAIATGDESKAFRSEAEIAERLAICEQCELLDPTTKACTHPDCGCTMDPARSAYWSALSYRSKTCPLTPPKWT